MLRPTESSKPPPMKEQMSHPVGFPDGLPASRHVVPAVSCPPRCLLYVPHSCSDTLLLSYREGRAWVRPGSLHFFPNLLLVPSAWVFPSGGSS